MIGIKITKFKNVLFFYFTRSNNFIDSYCHLLTVKGIHGDHRSPYLD